MNRKNIFFALLTFLCSVSLSAQTAEEIAETKKQINKIKKDIFNQYIYADATAATEQDAKETAEEMLIHKINEWAVKKKYNAANLVICDRKELWGSMALPRGNMFRCFLYVKKSDIHNVDNVAVVQSSTAPTADSAGAFAPTESVTKADALPATVAAVMACGKYSELVELLKQKKQEGKIGDYARYAQIENRDAYYLAIYNKQGSVVAVLSPGAQRVNIKTGLSDSVNNYSGHGAIGFILNE